MAVAITKEKIKDTFVKTHVQLSGWVMGRDRKYLESQARKSLDCC